MNRLVVSRCVYIWLSENRVRREHLRMWVSVAVAQGNLEELIGLPPQKDPLY